MTIWPALLALFGVVSYGNAYPERLDRRHGLLTVAVSMWFVLACMWEAAT